jgi:hypothetical protein
MFGAPPPQISNDCRRHEAAPESTACSALGVDAKSVDFTRDRHLCKESDRGGRNHRRVGGREPAAPPTASGVILAGRGSL